MSYYCNPRRFRLTHHAIRRAKERLNMRGLNDDQIHEMLEEYFELAIFSGYKDDGGVIFINHQYNITFVLDKNMKIIKTVY